MTLAALGWDAAWEDAFEPYDRDGVVPARVAIRHHGPCVLQTEDGPLGGMPAGRLGEDDLPAVGDWVVARPLPGERRAPHRLPDAVPLGGPRRHGGSLRGPSGRVAGLGG